jgi:hypothetical protein
MNIMRWKTQCYYELVLFKLYDRYKKHLTKKHQNYFRRWHETVLFRRRISSGVQVLSNIFNNALSKLISKLKTQRMAYKLGRMMSAFQMISDMRTKDMRAGYNSVMAKTANLRYTRSVLNKLTNIIKRKTLVESYKSIQSSCWKSVAFARIVSKYLKRKNDYNKETFFKQWADTGHQKGFRTLHNLFKRHQSDKQKHAIMKMQYNNQRIKLNLKV